MVRFGQRLADRIAAELRAARGRVLLVRGADGSLSGALGNRSERVCPVLSGSLAACGMKRDDRSLSGDASSAQRRQALDEEGARGGVGLQSDRQAIGAARFV